MNAKPITFHDRYTGALETEEVYGERWLRWAYETMLGRATLPLIFARPLFSMWFGWRMSRPSSTRLIEPFIGRYRINMDEVQVPPGGFVSFNDFFCRELKPGARPLPSESDAVVFPADGRHLGFPEIGREESVFAKGQRWDLGRLLNGDAARINRYQGGSLILSRLCPVDYHHFHFPLEGTVPTAPGVVEGPLYSVNPIALRRRLNYMWENKRVITPVEHPRIGEYLIIEIGATNVGSVIQELTGFPVHVATGQRKGRFEFGGSSVITLFAPHSVRLADDLIEHSRAGRELYAHVNDHMGVLL